MSLTTYEAIVVWAEREAPREICGLLVQVPYGAFDYLALVPSDNVASANDEYMIDPDVHLREIASGSNIVGVVHSHVRSSAALSEMDKAAAVPGFLYAVYSVRDRRMLAWETMEGLPFGDWASVTIEVE